MTAKDHNRLVGIFLLIHGGFQSFVMLMLSLVYGGIGIAIATTGKNDDKFAALFLVLMIAVIVVMWAIMILPQVIGGWKMLKEKANAKTWGTVGSILACISFPLGTAAGVYGLWFLFGEEGKRFYLGEGSQNYVGNLNQQNQYQSPPQQPYNWK